MKLRDLSARDLNDWLDLLSRSHEGMIKLINMFLSQEQKLVSQDILRSFLADCISLSAKTTDDALASFEQVCGDGCYFALCSAEPLSIGATSILVTVWDSYLFHRYILGRPKTIVKFVLPLAPESHDDADERAYREALAKVTSYTAWYNEAGTLGKPFPDPKHVWFTDLEYLDAEIRADSSSATESTKVRDALGLIDTKDNTYLLSLRFFAGQLHAISDLRMARPGFADRGNRRFAVYIDGAAGSVYRDNWGLTVHLGKLKAKPPQVANGVPERICSPIPLSHIGSSLKVIPIGWVVGNRGEEIGVDDDGAFIDRLRGRRRLVDIKNKVQTVANKP